MGRINVTSSIFAGLCPNNMKVQMMRVMMMMIKGIRAVIVMIMVRTRVQ